MFSLDASEYESDTFDSFGEDGHDSESDAAGILNFCDKITDELKSCFGRNRGNDDYCEDVYDDKFEAPESGSHSYYSDILAVAQIGDKNGSGSNFGTSSRGHPRSVPNDGTIIHPSNWICTGQWNPTTGTGPFEELFKVLEEHHQTFSVPENSEQSVLSPIFYPQEWEPMNPILSPTYDEELSGIVSIDGDYPRFIDSFHRWNNNNNNNPCAVFSSANHTFMPQDYHSSF